MDLQLKKLRLCKRLTQEELAEQIGTTLRKISAWERKETPIPLVDAARIADVLECSLDELAGRDWDPGGFADPVERELMSSFRALSDEGQETAANVVSALRSSYPREGGAPGVVAKSA